MKSNLEVFQKYWIEDYTKLGTEELCKLLEVLARDADRVALEIPRSRERQCESSLQPR